MKRAFLYLVIILLLIWMGARFVQQRRGYAAKTIQQIQAVEGYPIEAAASTLSRFVLTRRYAGTVTGGEETDIVPLVGEYVAHVLVREGQTVLRGQTVCELSHDNPSASYQQAKLGLDNAERELSRVQALYDKGAVSRQMLDGLTLSRDIARERLVSSERLLTVTSPIDGIVSDLRAEPGKFAPPGVALAKVVSRGDLRVRVEVPSGDRDLVKQGASCDVLAGGLTAAGRVQRLALSADKETRGFAAWVELLSKRSGFAFRPGVLVDVDVKVVDIDTAVTVDQDALLRAGDHWRVFIVNGNRALVRDVEVGGQSRGRAWIRSGLEPGAAVVVSGASQLFDGAPVRIITRS